MREGRNYLGLIDELADGYDLLVMGAFGLGAFAPDFHRHIAAKQARGAIVRKGDRILIYEVQATEPEGRVLITEETAMEFF